MPDVPEPLTPPPAEPLVINAAERGRYEAHLDGELAGILEYIIKYARIALVHTEVLPHHEGRGVASTLIRFGLDDARRRGLRVIVICPFVQEYLTRHPEDDDLVVGGARATPS